LPRVRGQGWSGRSSPRHNAIASSLPVCPPDRAAQKRGLLNRRQTQKREFPHLRRICVCKAQHPRFGPFRA
jgi:hypothetical protein